MLEHPSSTRADHAPSDPTVDEGWSRRYLAIIAAAAERLMAADDPATMVDDLFALIRTELRLDVFFNYRLDGDRLLLEAHAGLTPAQAAAGRELAIGQAVCGCAARDRQKVHATAIQASGDPMVAFVRSMGLDAYACTPLLHGQTLLGTLGFGRRWAPAFTDDEFSFIHTICHYVALAKYRLHTETTLRRGIAEREALLGELNHRVRNALQLAISIVRIDVHGASEQETRTLLRRAVARLEVMATAHRALYASAEAEKVDVATLLTSVAEQALDRDIDIVADAVHAIPVEQAVALALLVHGRLIDLSSHAAAAVRLTLHGAGDRLRIDLLGLDAADEEDSGHASGGAPRMAAMLVRQLRATMERDTTGLTITLPTGNHG